MMKDMPTEETQFLPIYAGHIRLYSPNSSQPPEGDEDSVYYSDRAAYQIDSSGIGTGNCPTVTVCIPVKELFKKNKSENEKEIPLLKRLRWYFNQMENDTTTYAYTTVDALGVRRKQSLYNGEMLISAEDPFLPPEIINDNTYWQEDISYILEPGHKMAKDCPGVVVQIPVEKLHIAEYNTAAADFCLRRFRRYFDALNAELYNRSRSDKENGKYYLQEPGQEILVRNGAYFALCPTKYYTNLGGCNAVLLEDDQLTPPEMCLCIRMQVQLPEKKLKKAIKMLCKDLPETVEKYIDEFNIQALERVLALTEKQQAIRSWLENSPYCAFIANGNILPRAKGTSLPMTDALPFTSPPQDEIEIAGIRGMGIRRGVTVITGGGYSGKSTLLDAIAAGICDHIAGDGREFVITDRHALEIAAEDGRCIKRVNISPFIKWLPGGNTADFTTDHASGSTSQAANIMESIADGAKLLLIDEDRSATNFMIRDRMMKMLIEKEPITPYTDRVRELADNGISTILVIGGSGEYLGVADRIYRMDAFVICDVTGRGFEIWHNNGDTSHTPPKPAAWIQKRALLREGFSSYPTDSTTELLEVNSMGYICLGDEAVDIRGIGGLLTDDQKNAVAFILRYLMLRQKNSKLDISAELKTLYEQIQTNGLHMVYSNFFTTCRIFMELPRICDVLAVIHRMRHTQYTFDAD